MPVQRRASPRNQPCLLTLGTRARQPVTSQIPETANHEKLAADAPASNPNRRGFVRALGLGVVTGAAGDDCSAIGIYASARELNSAPRFCGPRQ
jgi:hypothetical protein